MFITWLIAGAIATGLFVAFFDEIMNWAKDVFNRLSNWVRKAWVYIRRVPGGIKQMVRYIQNGEMVGESKTTRVDWDDVVRMHEAGEIDDDTFNALKAGRDKKIAEIDRDR